MSSMRPTRAAPGRALASTPWRGRRLTVGSSLGARRHVVLPPDIAKVLPKQRLLTEVRRPPLCPARRPVGPPGARPGRIRATAHPSCQRRGQPAQRPGFPLKRTLWRLTPRLTQAEWRGMGVQQSRGWVHYAIHRPEPHIMLFRCVGHTWLLPTCARCAPAHPPTYPRPAPPRLTHHRRPLNYQQPVPLGDSAAANKPQ